MDVVLSAGREQVITLTCISKGVCGERPSDPGPPPPPPLRVPHWPARPSVTNKARPPTRPAPPPRAAADATGPGNSNCATGAGPTQGGARQAAPRPPPPPAPGPGPAPAPAAAAQRASPKGWRFWIADIRYASLPSAEAVGSGRVGGGGGGGGRRRERLSAEGMLSRRRLQTLSGGRDWRRPLIYRLRVTPARTGSEGADWPTRAGRGGEEGGRHAARPSAAAPRLA